MPRSRSRSNAGLPSERVLLQAMIFSPIHAASPAGLSDRTDGEGGRLGGVLVHVAGLLRSPVLDRARVVLLLLCPRPGRNGQAGSSKMDRRDSVWLVSGEPRRHACPEVAAMGDEAVISEPHGHQLMPESRDLASGHPRGRGRAAERVAGQRRDDDRERIGGICAVRRGITKKREDRQVLQERPGPSVGEQQGERAWPATFSVHQVQSAGPQPQHAVGARRRAGAETRGRKEEVVPPAVELR